MRQRVVFCLVVLALNACAGPAPAPAPTTASLVTPPATANQAVTAIAVFATPTGTPQPTPAPSPTPGPTLRQMTTGGCCTQPGWSPDGTQIWFIDQPPGLPGGLWAVDPVAPLDAVFVDDTLGIVSPDGALLAYPVGDTTVIERRATGETWTVPAYGRAISFSPDGTQIAWQVASSTQNFDRRLVQVWVAAVDGSGVRQVGEWIGGGLNGWLPDGRRLLISQRDAIGATPTLGIFDPATAEFTPLVSGDFIRNTVLSPNGNWIAYTEQFSGDADRDGIWIRPIDGGAARRLSVYGAYRWAPDDGLIVIPLELGAQANRVVRVDAATGDERALTNPTTTPLRILGGDWALAPDGRRIAFVSRDDRNIWLLEIPVE